MLNHLAANDCSILSRINNSDFGLTAENYGIGLLSKIFQNYKPYSLLRNSFMHI